MGLVTRILTCGLYSGKPAVEPPKFWEVDVNGKRYSVLTEREKQHFDADISLKSRDMAELIKARKGALPIILEIEELDLTPDKTDQRSLSVRLVDELTVQYPEDPCRARYAPPRPRLINSLGHRETNEAIEKAIGENETTALHEMLLHTTHHPNGVQEFLGATIRTALRARGIKPVIDHSTRPAKGSYWHGGVHRDFYDEDLSKLIDDLRNIRDKVAAMKEGKI